MYNYCVGRLISLGVVLLVLRAGAAFAGDWEVESIEIGPARPQVPLLGEVSTTDIPTSFFYEKVSPIIREEELLTAGYISINDKPLGKIIDATYEQKGLSGGDTVYIDRGGADGVRVGDRFFIYRRIRKVSSLETNRYIGYIITILGKLEVVSVNKPVKSESGWFSGKDSEAERKSHTAKCTIIETNKPVFNGELIIPEFSLYVPTIDEDRPLEEKIIEGRVLAIGFVDKAGAVNDIIYLDVGRNAGVMEGDFFALYRAHGEESAAAFYGYKNRIGKAQVITVREKTATAVVTHSMEEIVIGTLAEYIQER